MFPLKTDIFVFESINKDIRRYVANKDNNDNGTLSDEAKRLKTRSHLKRALYKVGKKKRDPKQEEEIVKTFERELQRKAIGTRKTRKFS